ncbi:leucocin A/sakacin P family class II bacteriocin [Leuconostoc mesenteroides]|uniref:leucocin A/sakacin P family class II bacteriocin n=1 Tax=Leuconostoc mesenteroides TaxID=1245 RepID=UPI0035CE95AD
MMNMKHTESYEQLDNSALEQVIGGKNYGNGVHCTKKGCSVDWGYAWTNIANNSVMNGLTGGNAGWHN